MHFRHGAREEPEINLIPFIDVLLVVLIFLMLSTTYSKFTEMQLRLPVADADAAARLPQGSDRRRRRPTAATRSTRTCWPTAASRRSPPRWRGRGRRQGQRGHHQRRRQRRAPVGDHGDGSRAPRRPDADHLRHAIRRAGGALTLARCSGPGCGAARWPGCCGRCRWLFGAAGGAAARAVSRGLAAARERVGVPVVVVGNVVAGGAGKTPVVIAIVRAPAGPRLAGRRGLARPWPPHRRLPRGRARQRPARRRRRAAADPPRRPARRCSSPRRRVEAARALLARHPDVR